MTQLDYKHPSCLELVKLRTVIDCNKDAYPWSPLTKSILVQIMTAYSNKEADNFHYFREQVQEDALKKLKLSSKAIFIEKACFKVKIKKAIRRGLQLSLALPASPDGVTTAGVVITVDNLTAGTVLNLTNVSVGTVATITDATTGVSESVEITAKDAIAGTITITRNPSGLASYVSQSFTAGSIIALGPTIGLQSDSECSTRLSDCNVELPESCCGEYRLASIKGCVVETPRYWNCDEEEDIMGETYREEEMKEQYRKMFGQIEQQLLFGTGQNTTVLNGMQQVGQKQEINGILSYWAPQFSTITVADCCAWSTVGMMQKLASDRRAYGETGKLTYVAYTGSNAYKSIKSIQSAGNFAVTLFQNREDIKSYFDIAAIGQLLQLENEVMTLTYSNITVIFVEDDSITNTMGSDFSVFIDWNNSDYIAIGRKADVFTNMDGSKKVLPGTWVMKNVTDPVKMDDPNCPTLMEWMFNFQQIFRCPAKNYVVRFPACTRSCA